MVPTLTSERLCLRPLTLSDAQAVQKLAGVFEVADTTFQIPHPYEDGMAEAWIERVQEANKGGESLTLAITLQETSDLVGSISLIDIKEGHQAEIGYWVGVSYWNTGICTEASNLVKEHAFTTMGLVRLYAHHFSRNPASGRVLQKMGMSHEGTLIKHIVKWDKLENLELYGMVHT